FAEGGLLRRVSGVNNPGADHRKAVARALDGLETIKADIEALTLMRDEEILRDRDEMIARLKKGVAEHHEEQRALYRQPGEKHQEFLAAYREVVMAQRRYAEWRETPEVTGPLGNDWEAWCRGDGRFLISPAAGDFPQFFQDLYEICCDPGARGWRNPDARHPDVRSSSATHDLSASSWGRAWGW